VLHCTNIQITDLSVDDVGQIEHGGDCSCLVDQLDQQFTALTERAGQKTLLFADRFPFRYFTDDYGLDYYAAFAGCSAETEASFETVVFLANKADELGLDTIYTIEGGDGKIARTVIENTKSKDKQTAVLNSIQSVTDTQIADGATYLSLMQQNYAVLQEHLG
jgi:zinc transport system substrate-binding protein